MRISISTSQVHLIRSSDGLFEYSEKFDFEISEQSLFAIQDHIASSAVFNIATALNIEQSDNGKVPEYNLHTANPGTYERFAKGNSKAAGQKTLLPAFLRACS